MGVIAKLKKQADDTVGVGVHLVIIDDMKIAKNKQGMNLVNEETGEAHIEVVFKAGDGKKISRIFFMTEKSEWVFEKLCKAVKFNISKEEKHSVNEVRGRRLWICVGVKYEVKNGKLVRDSTGKPITYYHVLAQFFEVFDPMIPPAINGDPRLTNDGVPSGKFLMNKPEELPEDFAEQIFINA